MSDHEQPQPDSLEVAALGITEAEVLHQLDPFAGPEQTIAASTLFYAAVGQAMLAELRDLGYTEDTALELPDEQSYVLTPRTQARVREMVGTFSPLARAALSDLLYGMDTAQGLTKND